MDKGIEWRSSTLNPKTYHSIPCCNRNDEVVFLPFLFFSLTPPRYSTKVNYCIDISLSLIGPLFCIFHFFSLHFLVTSEFLFCLISYPCVTCFVMFHVLLCLAHCLCFSCCNYSLHATTFLSFMSCMHSHISYSFSNTPCWPLIVVVVFTIFVTL